MFLETFLLSDPCLMFAVIVVERGQSNLLLGLGLGLLPKPQHPAGSPSFSLTVEGEERASR